MSDSHSSQARGKQKRVRRLRVLVELGGLVVLTGLGALVLVFFGRPQVHISSSSSDLTDISVAGVDAHLRSLAVTIDGKAIEVERAGSGIVPFHSLPAGVSVHLDGTVSSPSWLSWLVGSTTSTSVVLHTPQVRPDTTVTLARAGSRASSVSRHVVVHFGGPVSALSYRGAPQSLIHP